MKRITITWNNGDPPTIISPVEHIGYNSAGVMILELSNDNEVAVSVFNVKTVEVQNTRGD